MAEVLQLGNPSETVRRQAILRQIEEAVAQLSEIPDEELIDLVCSHRTAYAILFRANYLLQQKVDKMSILGQAKREKLAPKRRWMPW